MGERSFRCATLRLNPASSSCELTSQYRVAHHATVGSGYLVPCSVPHGARWHKTQSPQAATWYRVAYHMVLSGMPRSLLKQPPDKIIALDILVVSPRALCLSLYVRSLSGHCPSHTRTE
jgi:hypothetical protein